MQKSRKKTTSVLALLLAMLAIMPAQTAEAAATGEKSTNKTANDSPVHWSTELPTEGDKLYTTDTGWHRLVLEFGDYCTNSIDSSGNYVDISPNKESSWPEYAWGNSATANSMAGGQPENWLGKNTAEKVSKGTSIRNSDAALYRNGEYSMDGMNSLYIKYAGTNDDGMPCYYISPCDSSGNREKKLWALDCCLDLTGSDLSEDQDFDDNTKEGIRNGYNATGIKPICDGIEPSFKLLTPTFTEFETLDNFKYAGVAISYYRRDAAATGGTVRKGEQQQNIGHIYADYIDNNKWIIMTGEDGSWTIRSAGHIDWDYSDESGDMYKLLGGDGFGEKFANAIGQYIKAFAFRQYGAAGRSDSGIEYQMIERYYIAPWVAKSWVYYPQYAALTNVVVPMLLLDRYARNVFIIGGYKCYGTEGFNPSVHEETAAGEISIGYGAKLEVTWDQDEYNFIMSSDIDSYYSHYDTDGTISLYGEVPRSAVGLTYFGTKKEGSEEIVYPDLAELFEFVPVRLTMTYRPSNGKGAFTGLYVGTAIESETYNPTNEDVIISSNTTKTLGLSDINEDGCADKIGFIGTPYSKGAALRYNKSVTIEEGATLQIDAPTYVTSYTTIHVKGKLIISPGAFLCGEDLSYTPLGSFEGGFSIVIYDTGSVLISNGAMLDVGFSYMKVDGGSFVNNGVFVQGGLHEKSLWSSVNFYEGSIENNSSALFICGGTVRDGRRMYLINEYPNFRSKTDMLAVLSNVNDWALLKYDPDNEKIDIADFRFYDSVHTEADRIFRNNGMAFIAGAIKAESEGGNYIVGSGELYRARDFYGIAAEVFGDLSNHKTILDASGAELTTDPTIKKFYEFTNIRNGGTVINDGNEDTWCLNNNVMALRVGTGSTGTDKIASFKITYFGADGKKHVENVDPAALADSYNFVRDCTHCGETEDQSGSRDLSPHGGTMKVYSEQSFSKKLEPYTNVTYVFQSLFEMEYVESIAIIGTGTSAWSCTELDLYRVKYLMPLREYGWSSWDWYVPFEGTLLAETALKTDTLTGVNSETFTWDAEDVEFGTGKHRLNAYEVPSTIESKSDNGFVYYSASTESKPYTTVEDDYTFSLTLADTEGSGIEEYYVVDDKTSFDMFFSGNEIRKMEEDSYILMKLYYFDTNGSLRLATMNYTLSAAEWANYMLSDTDQQGYIHGLFQQGEDIVFKGVLPDFKKVFECYITYEDKDDDATIAVAAASIGKYSGETVKLESGMLGVDNLGSPSSFYCASDLSGIYVTNGQSMKINMKEWNGTESIKPKQKGSRYLVVIKTDEMEDAATVRDISVIFTYKTLANVPATTGSYDLRTAVNDYYGYWLSSDGKDSGCAYKSAVSSGGELYFVIDVESLYTFTSATFSIEADPTTSAGEAETDTAADASTDNAASYNSTGKDEWQMSSIAIYELTELGERRVILGDGIEAMDVTTNRTYYRDNKYGTRGAVNRGLGPLMVGPGQSKTINFEEDGGSTISGGGEIISKNKLTDIQYLNYVDTKQDFGLNAKRAKYLITVQVEGDSITSVEDGDCGSKNQFYFQLVFQDSNGNQRTSPLVLSNQQLRSDGFRTGTAEEFAIYTNDDYGSPIQINIIPDDTASTSDVFDKLCIDYITVSKVSGTGVSVNWVAEDVGWIDIEYKDDGGEQTGRSDAELIRSFELKDAGYNVWIEFGIVTGPTYIDEEQFVGQVLADITYRDSGGAVKNKSNVDVVARIAEYAERMTELGSATEGALESVPSYMFRKGYTNRFLMQFDDISALINIKLKIDPTDESSLAIKEIFARQVFDEGSLALNKLNEYQHHYGKTPQDLTSSTNGSVVKIEPKGGSATATFVFSSGNSIQINTADGEGSVEVTEGETVGKNDYITMTAEIEDITGIDFDSTISADVIYKNIYGDLCAAGTTLVFDNNTKKFMIPTDSLPATPNIGMAYQVELTSAKLSGCVLKSAVVNHMRDGEILNEVSFIPGKDTKLDREVPIVIAVPDSEVDEYAKENNYITYTQNLFLQLGSLTKTTMLSEASDLKIALVYTRSDDPYLLDRTSDFVSALDCGYSIIDSSSTLCIPFSLEKVGSVKSILLKTTDSTMKLNAAQGCIAVEEKSNLTGKTLSSGWVNLPADTELISGEGTTMSSDGKSLTDALSGTSRITPIDVSMKVSTINRADAVARVTLYYKDTSGANKSLTQQMQASDWNYSGARFLTVDFKTPSYFTMETFDYDSSNTAGITVGSIEVSWYDSNGTRNTSSVNTAVTLTEGTALSSSLISTTLTGTVKNSDGTQTVPLENNTVREGRTDYGKLTLIGKGDVTVSAKLPGLAGELEIVCVDTSTNQTVFGPINAGSAAETLAYYYAVPANTGTETVSYCITIRSKNMPHQYSAKVYVDVEPALYIEGFAYRADGTLISGFIATDGTKSNDLRFEGTCSPGDVLTVYARVMNNSGTQLAYTLTSVDGSAFTVKETANATVQGNAGKFTKYEITVGSTETSVDGTFKVCSVADPTVYYTLVFNTAAKTPAP